MSDQTGHVEENLMNRHTQVSPERLNLTGGAGEVKSHGQQVSSLTQELREVERQRGIFLRQRNEFEAETKRLYAALAAKDLEMKEIERQRDVFLQQRDGFEAETKMLYAGHTAMEEEINFLKFRNEETSRLHDRVVEQNWRGEKPYEEYYCSFPFERIEILPRGEVYTCCSGMLKSGYDIGNIYKEDFAQIWNSEKAKRLRYSVTNGNFEYCHAYCMQLTSRNQPCNEYEPHAVLKKGGKKFPYRSYQDCKLRQGPKAITLSCDETCNLQCPSCRTAKKAMDREQSARLLEMLQSKVQPLLKDCELLGILGSGEVFASTACSTFLKTLNAKKFPNLDILLATNAQLLTAARWAEFENLHDFPLILNISIDAANKSTYEKLRMGGSWERLCENMLFISGLRKKNIFRRLTLNFVVQADNFRQMGAFVALGQQWSADAVRFQYMTNWGTNSLDEYQRKNVFDVGNAYFNEAAAALREIMDTASGIKILQNIFEQ